VSDFELINSFVICVSTHKGAEIHDQLSIAGYFIVRKPYSSVPLS
jgi:hypothetical protein